MILMANAMMGAAGYQAAGGGGGYDGPKTHRAFIGGQGDDSSIVIGDVPVLDGASAFTLSTFVSFSSLTLQRRIFRKWDTHQEFIATYDSGVSGLLFGVTSDGSSNNRSLRRYQGALQQDSEFHLAVAWDGFNTWRLYIDGLSVATTQHAYSGSPASVFSGNGPLIIGQWLAGYLSDTRIYSAGLSAADVTTLANNRFTDSVSDNLVGWWPLDNDLLDYSGNAYHATGTTGTVNFELLP